MKNNLPLHQCFLYYLCTFCFLSLFYSSHSLAGEFPKKIVSLSPSTTEWIFALGLEKQLVGVTEQCDIPADAAKKFKVGAFMQTSLERILALRATDVVTVDGLPDVLRRKLQSSGIKVHTFNPQRLIHFPEQIVALGRALGVSAQAQLLGDRFQGAINEAKKSAQAQSSSHSFLIFVSTEPIFLVRKETWMSDLFETLGYVNAFDQTQVTDPFPRVSIENLFKLKAKMWIGFADKHSSPIIEQDRLILLSKKLGNHFSSRIHILPADLVQRPGPRLMDILKNSRVLGL